MQKLVIILTLSFASCDYVNTAERRIEKAEFYTQYFYTNREVFERLVREIRDDKSIPIGLLQSVTEMDHLKKKEGLQNRGISGFWIGDTKRDQRSIEFTTQWTEFPIGQMHLTKDCPDDKSKKRKLLEK